MNDAIEDIIDTSINEVNFTLEFLHMYNWQTIASVIIPMLSSLR